MTYLVISQRLGDDVFDRVYLRLTDRDGLFMLTHLLGDDLCQGRGSDARQGADTSHRSQGDRYRNTQCGETRSDCSPA